MDYQCKKCEKDFADIKTIFNHMKKDHNLKNKSEKLPCVVKNAACAKSFLSYDSLRSHLKGCSEVTKSARAQLESPVFKIVNDTDAAQDQRLECSSDASEDDISFYQYQFSHNFEPQQNNCENEIQYEFEYDFHNKSVTQDMFYKLKNFITLFVADVNLLKLSRKDNIDIFRLAGNLVDTFSEVICGVLNDVNNEMTAEQIISTTQGLILSEFSLYGSRYKFDKTISQHSSYVHPVEKAIGTRYEMKRDPDNKVAVPRLIQSTCQYVPIMETLRSLFQNDEFRELYFQYNAEKHECVDGYYKNFCCGDVFKSNELFNANPFAIQLQLITDDFELCSPLQSKAGVHKLTAVYFAIKNFPINFQSKLNNIHLVCICHSDDIYKSTQADFNNIWQMVVEDLRGLETVGISVGEMQIRGTIAWPSFDNLGGNLSLGYAGSFSALCYCRFCECDSKECSRLIQEDESKIRTIENYSTRLKTIENMSKIDYQETRGIRRYCTLNDLKYFHITTNISVDILHDLYEGTMPFVLKHLFTFMINLKILTKNELIQMIQFFDYGEINVRNIPSIVALEKSNIGQNGAQSKCLFLHIPFIFAKFQHDERVRKVWDSFETLARFSQYVHSTHLTDNDLNDLAHEASAHLQSVQRNFNVRLTPKHHILLHYGRTIKSMGPVVYMNMMRFENKHKVFKELIHRSPNFENVCKTLAVRHQQNLVMDPFRYKDAISCGSKHIGGNNIDDNAELLEMFKNGIPIFETKYLCCNNYKYKKDMFVIHENQLFQIERILIIENDWNFVCSRYNVLDYMTFFGAYKISQHSAVEKQIIKLNELLYKKPHEKRMVGDDQFIIADTLEIKSCVNFNV